MNLICHESHTNDKILIVFYNVITIEFDNTRITIDALQM